ncbi:hypothetical protein DBR11_04810 [Pedobacter sp. HMWF019]|nr:hypothetical protein DBR11_04810 [Pedobacter sp. HMWF019]
MSKSGLLDWSYKPLDEINLADNKTKIKDLLLKFGIKYKVISNLNIQLNYQNEQQVISMYDLHNSATYYARDLINKFSSFNPTNNSITYNFPKGGILEQNNYEWQAHNFRVQANYDQTFNKNTITAIAGAEVRQLETTGTNQISYGYNDQFGTYNNTLNYQTSYPTNPSGSDLLPGSSGGITGTLNRYVSYYANAAYDYDQRYSINLSARKDGANLFGAKTNDKITPLWSSGIRWNINKESFYTFNWLPILSLRATYGYNGNTYEYGTAYLTGVYSSSLVTGAPIIENTKAPNPQLRWEKVRNINFALEFSSKKNAISGTIELYKKNGQDLVQPTSLAPQTGFTTYQANTASTETKGIDITLQSQILNRKFKWQTIFTLTSLNDKVVKYDAPRTSSSIYTPGAVSGKSLYALFSYKWAGLNPQNGNPRGYLGGKISEDYMSIINNFNPDSLKYNGSLIPTVFGSFRNELSFDRFNLSINIIYRLGYVFRRTSSSLNYTSIIQNGQNKDFTQRWQKPGDELSTSVPSLVYPSDFYRNSFYQYSEVLIESGNHIRLQDVRLAFEIPSKSLKKLNLSRLNIFGYANNIGIIWRKNKFGIDPNAAGQGGITPPQFSLSFGINANF